MPAEVTRLTETKLVMEQRISVLTIGAVDLHAMRSFYENILGWQPIAENRDIAFYKMNGFLFSIAKRNELASFIGVNPEGNGFKAITLGYNVQTETEVFETYEQLRTRGVKILNEPTKPPFGGLFFYFEDIEGNILEVAYNPFIPLDNYNNAIDHKPIADL
jgi:catechol 2,3-dioxygenase-like lactoylglutathione lyase family enzyme